MVDREKIDNKVKKLFLDFFQKEESNLQKSYSTDHFFNSRMGLLPGDVLAFLYAVEKEFGFQIPSSYILDGKFKSLENVTDIICEVLAEKENKTGVCR